MKVSSCQEVRYSDVTTSFRWRLGALFRCFQEAAIQHSALAGDGARQARECGFGWMMHRVGIQIEQYPLFEQKIQINTWSRGARGIKAYRDFSLSLDGSTIATGTSIWVYLDLNAAQIKRVPPELMEKYTIENDRSMELDLEKWRPLLPEEPIFTCRATTRFQDFDSNGHMNNSVYADLLENALQRYLGTAPLVSQLCLQFDKGVEPHIGEVEMVLSSAGANQLRFMMRNADITFCRGECVLANSVK